MTDSSATDGDRQEQPQFRTLLIGHDPQAIPEATLALAAIAARNGLRFNGEPMENEHAGRPCTLRWAAKEVGLNVDAIRRGVAWLLKHKRVRNVVGGYYVCDDVLPSLWSNYRQRIKITAPIRGLGLRAAPMLAAALVAGQVDKSGILWLSLKFLGERLGFGERKVTRSLNAARAAGAIHSWKRPPSAQRAGWRLYLAVGPERTDARTRARAQDIDETLRTVRDWKGEATESVTPVTQRHERGEVSVTAVSNRPSLHRELSVTALRTVRRLPDVPPENHPHPSSGRAAARVCDDAGGVEAREGEEHRSAPAQGAEGTGASGSTPTPTVDEQRKAATRELISRLADRLAEDCERRGVQRLGAEHEPDVAGLLHTTMSRFDQVNAAGNRRRGAGAVRELAKLTIARHRSPERLARWLRRISVHDLADLEGHIRRRYRAQEAA